MSEPYDVSTKKDREKGWQRLVDRTGHVTIVIEGYRVPDSEISENQVFISDIKQVPRDDNKTEGTA